MKMKQKNILKLTFLISLILHLLIYFLIKDIVINDINDNNKKVKLSFKRGGDVSKKDSKLKENTPKIDNNKNSKNINTANKSNNNMNIYKNKTQESTIDLSKLTLHNDNYLSNNIYSSNYLYVNKALETIPKEQKEEILELYGDALGDYGNAEIDFIVNNLREIGRITQYHFIRRGYPLDAIYLRQSGINIVEFYLHPNGDITDLKITKDSKSHILDKNTLTTIKIAYKDYPRPTTKTKIIYSIKYYLIN